MPDYKSVMNYRKGVLMLYGAPQALEASGRQPDGSDLFSLKINAS